MTPAQFRRIALSFLGAVEGTHGGHPDFRVAGKVFASLGHAGAASAMVKLTPDQQAMLMTAAPSVFKPSTGAWGLRGYTNAHLPKADLATMRQALTLAWQGLAPKSSSKTKEARKASAPKTVAAKSTDSRALARTSARVQKAIKASKLPGIEAGTSYGHPSMKVAGKFLMRIKDADTLVFSCPLEEKAMLIEAAPEIYFETDHYAGWPAVLARVSAISDKELVHRIARAFDVQAPKKLKAGNAPASTSSKPSKKNAR